MNAQVIHAKYLLALAEMSQSQLRAQYYQKRIETGVWRERIGKSFAGGLPEHGGVARDEESILRDEVATMYRHIKLAEEHLDHAKGLLANLDLTS